MTDFDLLVEEAQHDNLQTVQSILDRNQEVVNGRDASGATSLHYAAFNGQRRIAKLLVERGADVNNRDSEFGLRRWSASFRHNLRCRVRGAKAAATLLCPKGLIALATFNRIV